MYINPFIMGVLSTIGVEMFIFMAIVIYYLFKFK